MTHSSDRRSRSVSAIVLAGGRASRFGADKLAAALDGESLLDRAVAAVRHVADEVIVVGRATSNPEVRQVRDAEPFGGPLAGLASALEHAGGSSAIVVGGDMPRLSPAVLRTMLARLDADPSTEAVVLAQPPHDTPGNVRRLQTLPLALLVVPARAAARAALAAGDRALARLLDRLATAEIAAAEWLRLDPEANTLLDVDTTADLERIRRRDLR